VGTWQAECPKASDFDTTSFDESWSYRMPLLTTDEPGHYDFRTDNVYFWMVAGTRRVRCAVSFEALLLLDPDAAQGPRSWGRRAFDAHREHIEGLASAKYDKREAEKDGTILVKSQNLSLIAA
jgi:hypothetical protein